MYQRTYRIGSPVGLIVSVRTVTVAGAAASLCFLVASSGLAAPPQASKPPAPRVAARSAVPIDTVETAQKALEAVQARIIAGVASRTELEDAQAALRIAVANARLLDARAELERKKNEAAQGVGSSYAVAISALAVVEREVALLQAQTDHLEQVTERLKVQVTAGLLSRAEADAASQKLRAAQRGLVIRKGQYARQKTALLEQRLVGVTEQQRAGIASQADVDKARAEYENALSESVTIK